MPLLSRHANIRPLLRHLLCPLRNRDVVKTGAVFSRYGAGLMEHYEYTKAGSPFDRSELHKAWTDVGTDPDVAGSVLVEGTLANRVSDYFYAEMAVTNGVDPAPQSVEVLAGQAGLGPSGEDVYNRETRTGYAAPSSEGYSNDEDGNLRAQKQIVKQETEIQKLKMVRYWWV